MAVLLLKRKGSWQTMYDVDHILPDSRHNTVKVYFTGGTWDEFDHVQDWKLEARADPAPRTPATSAYTTEDLVRSMDSLIDRYVRCDSNKCNGSIQKHYSYYSTQDRREYRHCTRCTWETTWTLDKVQQQEGAGRYQKESWREGVDDQRTRTPGERAWRDGMQRRVKGGKFRLFGRRDED